MNKITAVWSGWAGGPGYSNFYFGGISPTEAQLTVAQDRVHDFFAAITLCLPTPVTISFQPSSQLITPGDGVIQDDIPVGSVAPPVVGAGGANFAAVSGACVIWRTGLTVGGRLLKGKTFLVPLSAGAYDTDGTILASRLAELRAAATALAAPGAFADEQQLQVWHRPTAGAGGVMSPTGSASVSDRVSILRSRRA